MRTREILLYRISLNGCQSGEGDFQDPGFSIWKESVLRRSFLERLDVKELSSILRKPVQIRGEDYRPKCRIVSLRTRKGDTLSSVNDLLRYVSAKEELLRKHVIIIDDSLYEEYDKILTI